MQTVITCSTLLTPSKDVRASVWEHCHQAPPDPILSITDAFKADPDPRKVNLGVGAYRDEDGQPCVLEVVRRAEQALASSSGRDKEYLPASGTPDFCRLSRELAFGSASKANQEARIATVQTLSGTGALRLGSDFIAAHHQGPRAVLLPEPSWGIHPAIFQASGHAVCRYRYYDAATKGLDMQGLLEDLRHAEEGTVVVLHVCAHNPTGVDPTPEQWQAVLEVVQRRRLLPFFDCAYQGFASGSLDSDAHSLRLFAAAGVELLLAQSYAKNMGLYGERVGALSVVCTSSPVAQRVESQLRAIVRPMYSSPPIHGAAVVATILGSSKLRSQWEAELHAMTRRIGRMREVLHQALQQAGAPGSWDHLLHSVGMFTFSGLSRVQCEHLTRKWHIYLTADGRISLAGLSEDKALYTALAIADALMAC